MIINRGYQKLSFVTKAASLIKFNVLINYLANEMNYNSDLKFVVVKKESAIIEFLNGQPVKMSQGFAKELLNEDDSVIHYNEETQELDETKTVNALIYKNLY